MAEARSAPPPVPPRIDLGETEEDLYNGHDKVGWSASNTSTEEKEPKIRNSNTEMKVPPRPKKAQTVAKAIAKESGHNAGRASNNQKKPEQKKNRPVITIVSAQPMDQSAAFPNRMPFDKNTPASTKSVNNNAQLSSKPPAPDILVKPKRPAPVPSETLRRAQITNSRPKSSKSSKQDSSSIFYTDLLSDSRESTSKPEKSYKSNLSSSSGQVSKKQPFSQPNIQSTPKTDKSSKSNVSVSSGQVSKKQPVSLPNMQSKPSAPSRKPIVKNEEKSNETIAAKEKLPPNKTTEPKPKLKPTIITAKKPVELKQSSSGNVTNAKASEEDPPPSRPSFPPSAEITNEMPKHSRETGETGEKKQKKSKPSRPPLAKAKPSRPPPAKAPPGKGPPTKAPASRTPSTKSNATRKAPADVADKTERGSSTVKPSGPARALAKFDYTGETNDDLTFKAGDTILLTSKIDDAWLLGYLEGNVMHQGLFPSNFVEVVVPLKEQPRYDSKQEENVKTSEPHAVALHDFDGQGEGELTFMCGQTIILTERVNADWLRGSLNGKIGIFPSNFVEVRQDLPLTTDENSDVVTPAEKIEKSEEWCEATHDYNGEHTDDLSFVAGTTIKIIERISDDWFRGTHSGKSGIFPSSFVKISADDSVQDVTYVTAIHDYPGESPDDLSFKVGDRIKVLDHLNSEWLMGECNGRKGMLPIAFVEDLKKENTSNASNGASQLKIESLENFQTGKALHDFSGEAPGELHFVAGDLIKVLRTIDDNWSEGMINDVTGIFPTAFVKLESDSPKETIIAKALYDFAGESNQDLPFKAGDEIEVLRQLNDDWWCGLFAGKTGHFPASFVEKLPSK